MFAGEVDDTFSVKEVHRFGNSPVRSRDRYFWDVEYLRDEIVKGLEKTENEIMEIESLAIDTWGVDFGLIRDGRLMRDPHSYRDTKLKSTLDDLLEEVPKKKIFKLTGINHWNVPNSLWQYHYLTRKEPELIERTDEILMIPQLLSFMLGADRCGEETIASTSQMLDPGTRDWAEELLDRLNLPTELLPEIKKPGKKIGRLEEIYAEELDGRPDILLPVSHDTGSAVAGMPLGSDHKAFLSTGSWFILGVELEEPVLTEEAFEIEASNELGIGNTSRFLKNINGFFILEECRKVWKENDQVYEYDELIEMAREASQFGPLIDPDAELFLKVEGDMVERIASFCRDTGQEAPETEGKTSRCIFESLALKTALTLESLMDVAGSETDVLHLGGGGIRNELFCEMLASSVETPVYGGPTEAAAVGNILTQAIAYGKVEDIDEGRRMIEKEMQIHEFEPEDQDNWVDARKRMKRLLNK